MFLNCYFQKSTDVEVQKLLSECNYSGAISLLLTCKDSATEFMQYNCVQSLNKKLQETLLLTEFQLDTVLNEVRFLHTPYIFLTIKTISIFILR